MWKWTIAATVFMGLHAPIASAQESLKLGGVGPLSGGATSWGLAVQRGVQLAIDEVTAAGGLRIGDKTYAPTLIMYDDQYNAGAAKLAADRLVNQDQVKYVFGSAGSLTTLGALTVTAPAKVMQFSGGYAIEILKNEHNAAYNFRILDSNIEMAPPMVRWLRDKHPKVKKVALISASDWAPSVIPVLKKSYEDAGFEVWHESYERGTKEFTPLLTRMIAQKVDALDINSNAPGESGLLVKQARQAGFRAPIWQVGGPGVEEVMSIAGPLAEGFQSFDMFDFRSPAGKAFTDAYNVKYSGIISALTPAFYNSAKLLFEAMRRSGSTDTTVLVQTLTDKMGDYDAGLFGKLRWTGEKSYGNKHQILVPFIVVEVEKGKIVTRDTITPTE